MAHLPKLNQPHTGCQRIAFVEPCLIEGGDYSRLGVIWNLSTDGVYLVIDPAPEVGERVRISFLLPGESIPVKAAACVAWRNISSPWKGCGQRAWSLPPGCGLKFLDLRAPDRDRIMTRVMITYPVLDPSTLPSPGEPFISGSAATTSSLPH